MHQTLAVHVFDSDCDIIICKESFETSRPKFNITSKISWLIALRVVVIESCVDSILSPLAVTHFREHPEICTPRVEYCVKNLWRVPNAYLTNIIVIVEIFQSNFNLINLTRTS